MTARRAVVMGVAGAGKSMLAAELASRSGARFLEAERVPPLYERHKDGVWIASKTVTVGRGWRPCARAMRGSLDRGRNYDRSVAVTKSQYGGIATSLVAITLAGCSGGNEPSGMYKAADAERLANVAPHTPGWPPWPQKPEPKQPSSGESPEEVAARDPIYAKYRRRTAGIEQQWGSGNRWRDNDKLANLVVGVWDTAADAHVGFLASNDLSRAYGAKYGFVVKAEKVDGLGDEAWRLWAHGNGREVTYHWRRDNLVTEAHVHCYGDCGPDLDANVDAAARAWAETIDEEARSAG